MKKLCCLLLLASSFTTFASDKNAQICIAKYTLPPFEKTGGVYEITCDNERTGFISPQNLNNLAHNLEMKVQGYYFDRQIAVLINAQSSLAGTITCLSYAKKQNDSLLASLFSKKSDNDFIYNIDCNNNEIFHLGKISQSELQEFYNDYEFSLVNELEMTNLLGVRTEIFSLIMK